MPRVLGIWCCCLCSWGGRIGATFLGSDISVDDAEIEAGAEATEDGIPITVGCAPATGADATDSDSGDDGPFLISGMCATAIIVS